MFGGLSSTYFHKELIEYPCIDFVVRGDTTEKLILMLLNKLEKKDVLGFADIPNLTWKMETISIFIMKSPMFQIVWMSLIYQDTAISSDQSLNILIF